MGITTRLSLALVRTLLKGVGTLGSTPSHIAFILDGNRRWAKRKGKEISDGHDAGARQAMKVLRWCYEMRVPTVSLYIFSEDNLQRDPREVAELFSNILDAYIFLISDNRSWMKQRGVRFCLMGDLGLIPRRRTRQQLAQLLCKSRDNHRAFFASHPDDFRFTVNIGFMYSGTREIADASTRILRSNLDPSLVTDELLSLCSYTGLSAHPYPDLLIRTSGETRLSDFMPLQMSLGGGMVYFDKVLWPSFSLMRFVTALLSWQRFCYSRRRKVLKQKELSSSVPSGVGRDRMDSTRKMTDLSREEFIRPSSRSALLVQSPDVLSPTGGVMDRGAGGVMGDHGTSLLEKLEEMEKDETEQRRGLSRIRDGQRPKSNSHGGGVRRDEGGDGEEEEEGEGEGGNGDGDGAKKTDEDHTLKALGTAASEDEPAALLVTQMARLKQIVRRLEVFRGVGVSGLEEEEEEEEEKGKKEGGSPCVSAPIEPIPTQPPGSQNQEDTEPLETTDGREIEAGETEETEEDKDNDKDGGFSSTTNSSLVSHEIINRQLSPLGSPVPPPSSPPKLNTETQTTSTTPTTTATNTTQTTPTTPTTPTTLALVHHRHNQQQQQQHQQQISLQRQLWAALGELRGRLVVLEQRLQTESLPISRSSFSARWQDAALLAGLAEQLDKLGARVERLGESVGAGVRDRDIQEQDNTIPTNTTTTNVNINTPQSASDFSVRAFLDGLDDSNARDGRTHTCLYFDESSDCIESPTQTALLPQLLPLHHSPIPKYNQHTINNNNNNNQYTDRDRQQHSSNCSDSHSHHSNITGTNNTHTETETETEYEALNSSNGPCVSSCIVDISSDNRQYVPLGQARVMSKDLARDAFVRKVAEDRWKTIMRIADGRI